MVEDLPDLFIADISAVALPKFSACRIDPSV